MDKNVRTTSVLERLRQMRERELEEVTGRLAQQKILCQRYASNIEALTGLSNRELAFPAAMPCSSATRPAFAPTFSG